MHAFNELTLHVDALHANLKRYKSVMPMIKGNGYGFGMLELAKLMETTTVPFLGLSHLSEAIALREAGIQKPLFVLSFLPEQAQLIADYNLTPLVDTKDKLLALRKAKQEIPIHLAVNLGMNRFGAHVNELPPLLHLIEASPNLLLEGVMGHLSAPGDVGFETVDRWERETFSATIEQLPSKPKWIHLASTFGTPPPCCNLSRIGLGLFYPDQALTLRTQIVSIKEVQKGERIGYRSAPCDKGMKVAVMGIGYHDGLHPSYQPNLTVVVDGKKCRIVGEICMDFILVDVSNTSTQVGNWAEIFGPSQPLNELAEQLQINPRVLISALGSRIVRNVCYEPLRSTCRSI